MSVWKAIVNATMTSCLTFCNSILVGISDYLLKKLQLLQNCAAKLVYNKRILNIDDVLQELHWLKVKYHIDFKILVQVFNALHGNSPEYIVNAITIAQQNHFTRSQLGITLEVPKTRLKTAGVWAFSVAGPKLWNTLPIAVQNAKDINVFKKALKTHLFNSSIVTT